MPYVKNWLARKVSWIITTHNTFFPANDLSHKRSCHTFTFPRTNKCGTVLNQDEKKSLHLTTSRYTDEGAKSTIRCIRNICSVLNYPPTLFHAEHEDGRGWGVELVSGSHHSHTLLAPFAMIIGISASGVFGTVLVHIGLSVIKSNSLLSFIFYHSAN
jgi:hypothetical protein